MTFNLVKIDLLVALQTRPRIRPQFAARVFAVAPLLRGSREYITIEKEKIN